MEPNAGLYLGYSIILAMYSSLTQPNMATYAVFRDTHDPARHDIGFFTLRDIAVGEELSYGTSA
jgi:SET domain-containing protein